MKRNSFLDVVKGICIFFVIMTHYTFSKHQRADMFFFLWVGMAVPIFMIITGYVYSKSYEKNKINSFTEAYSTINLIPRLLRFTVPYAMAYLAEIILKFTMERHKFHLSKIFLKFFCGGEGYGSYYIPVMFQFIFLFPVIYFIVKKKGFWGVIICGAINAAYEVMTGIYVIGKPAYLILVFRFILVIAFGCYVALNEEIQTKKLWAILSFIIGLIYLLSMRRIHYPRIVFPYWKHVNMIACLYIIPIMGILIRKCRFGFLPLEMIGKATFNIFLVQKIYYHYFAKKYFYVYTDSFYLRLMINIVVCCVVGIIFYYIESQITTRLVQWSRKKLANRDPEKGTEKINGFFTEERIVESK